MSNHRIKMTIEGQEFETFEDILPQSPEFKILFVGKVPAPHSVSAGHYFYKNAAFWNRLKEFGIMTVPHGQYGDDCLVEHNYGITDIIKKPRSFGNEPSDAEYKEGIARFFDLLRTNRPKVLVFIYKGALDKILHIKYGIKTYAHYGFNVELESLFNSKVFAFPMPGTPCRREDAHLHMKELSTFIDHLEADCHGVFIRRDKI